MSTSKIEKVAFRLYSERMDRGEPGDDVGDWIKAEGWLKMKDNCVRCWALGIGMGIAVAIGVMCLFDTKVVNTKNEDICTIKGTDEAVEISWKIDNKEQSLWLYRDSLQKLTSFADSLATCSGVKGGDVKGNYFNPAYTYRCNKLFPKTEMTQEFDNGYFCKECVNSRKKDLTKKLKSLK